LVGVGVIVFESRTKISRIRYETLGGRYNKDRQVISLSQLRPGEAGEVVSIQKADRTVLQKLLAMTVIPGSRLKVELIFPVVVFQVENTRVAVDHRVAGEIEVCRIDVARSQ
jgi:Fe2+ transport system protein FeoA